MADFALPVRHSTNNVSDITVQIGKPFLQKVNIPNYANNYSPGLEIWLKGTQNANRVYASFDGILSFYQGDVNSFPLLNLQINDRVVRRINSITRLIEPAPKLLSYWNVEQHSVTRAISTLFTNAHDAAKADPKNPNRWHAIMRMQFDDGTRFKEYLDTDTTNRILELTNNFTAGDFSLMIECGDWIGNADDFTSVTGTNTIPQNINLTADDDPKVLILGAYDYTGINKNPAFYYWRLLKNANYTNIPSRRVRLITNHTLATNTNTFNHPFLKALNIDLDNEIKPLATIDGVTFLPGRTQATNNVLLIPIGRLANWGGSNLNGNDPSDFQWRITNDANLDFEVRIRPGITLNNVQMCGDAPAAGRYLACVDVTSTNTPGLNPVDPINNFVRTAYPNRALSMWENFGQEINQICSILQVPSELLVSIMGQESRGDERSVRFEPVTETSLNAIRNHSFLVQYIPNQSDRDAAIQGYLDMVGTNGRGLLDVPIGNIDTLIPDTTISWTNAILISTYFPGAVSPGLTHNILSTASLNWRWLIGKMSNVRNNFNLTTSFPVRMDYPNNNAYYFAIFNWLLIGRNAILMGAVKLKKDFLVNKTNYDPVLSWAGYNAGTPMYHNGFWGVEFNVSPNTPNYPVRAGWYYNGCQDVVAANGVNNTVRYWRNL